ncbi:MAG: DEAD/DEAH box helicase family protein [Gammaproteobacteria bacterium]|nr:DEAD/DEAH box helicase family protein [Gammaproteobacteria bacterium]
MSAVQKSPGSDQSAVTIINDPYQIPKRHGRQDSRGRVVGIESGRRPSGAYEIVPDPKGKDGGADFITRMDESPYSTINLIRRTVERWRCDGYPGVSGTTKDLLRHWADSQEETRPYFCQREVLEILALLCEADLPSNTILAQIRNDLAKINSEWNESIQRYAVKMATATGKTWVMAMLILWRSYLDKDGAMILVVTPNLTIAKRLSADLDPLNKESLYHMLLPRHMTLSSSLRVEVINWQKFTRREETITDKPLDSLTKKILYTGYDEDISIKETPETMINRVLRSYRYAKKITVINDEAHHCIPPRAGDDEKSVYAWFSILQVLDEQKRLGNVYDLSATPMFGMIQEGLPNVLFPWVVSDYPLIDAVEAGLTKIPMVPVDDDTSRKHPVYRDLYNTLEKPDRRLSADDLPDTLTALLTTLHGKYIFMEHTREQGFMPPVMIVVANNIRNAGELYKHIAGHYDQKAERWVTGKYSVFSNVKTDGSGPVDDPPTLLVHSKIDKVSVDSEWGKINKTQQYFFPPGKRNVNQYMEWIRDIFSTVGKPGLPGDGIRCVISVSMLTEGWDARTVTHIFGFRPFESQLLCEQVAGRALRRSIPLRATGEPPEPEYAHIFGVPFDFMPGVDGGTGIRRRPYTIMTVDDREEMRITFPNIHRYRYEAGNARIEIDIDALEEYDVVKTKRPSWTEMQGVTGRTTRDHHGEPHINEVVYELASTAAKKIKIPKEDAGIFVKSILFSSMVVATRQALGSGKIRFKSPIHLVGEPNKDKITSAIVSASSPIPPEGRIVPVFMDQTKYGAPRTHDTGSVRFDTTLPNRYPRGNNVTRKSELNIAACHSNPEVVMAGVLDSHPKIAAWARNYQLNWEIPYMHPKTGRLSFYEPDFVARIRSKELIHIVIEVKGEAGDDAARKADAVRKYWLPAVNRSEDLACAGRWSYMLLSGAVTDAREVEKALDTEISIVLRDGRGGVAT